MRALLCVLMMASAARSVSEKCEHAPSRPAPPAENRRNSQVVPRGARLLGAREALLRRAPSTGAHQDTTVYLTLDQAPLAVFPGAQIERRDVPSPPQLQATIKRELGRLVPTVWEPSYVTFTARQAGSITGYAVVVEEIGKHRPFTLIVAVTPDFKVKDVAVMVYRETRGGEITQRRFLAQYRNKRVQDPIQLDRDIVGISGATLSVHGANRAVHKALAVLRLVYGS